MKRMRNALLSYFLLLSSLSLNAFEPSWWNSLKHHSTILAMPPDIVTRDKIYYAHALWLRSADNLCSDTPYSKQFTLDTYGTLCKEGRTMAHYYHTLPAAPFLTLLKYVTLGYAVHELYVVAKELWHLYKAKREDLFAFYKRDRYTTRCSRKGKK